MTPLPRTVVPVIVALSAFHTCRAFRGTSMSSSRAPSRQQQQQQQQQRRQRVGSFGDVSLCEHTLNEEYFDASDDFLEEDGPKAQLLREIGNDAAASSTAPPRFGFGDTESSKSRIAKLADDLSGYVLPLERPSRWKLLYNDAPDVLGLRGGPLSRLVSIRQSVGVSEGNSNGNNSNRLDIELEYEPSDNVVQLAGSFLDNLRDDRLVQTVEFEYAVGAMNKVDLQLRGTSIESSRLSSSSSSSFALPSLRSPNPLPFVGFAVVFNDGDLRIDRTVQGDFLYIYRRIK